MATNQPAHYPPPPPPGNGIAVAGMVLGILGLVLCWFPFVGGLCALIGIILAALGMGRAKRNGVGRGMAIAGLVCGILGLIAGVVFIVVTMMAVSSFNDYVKKSGSSTESRLNLHRIEKNLKIYYATTGKLPESAGVMPGPAGAACLEDSKKMPAKPRAAWEAAGWHDLDFSVDEPALYSYRWDKISDQSGSLVAIGDLDCDATLATTKIEIKVVAGNIEATYLETTPD